MVSLQKLIKFTKLTTKYQKVIRAIWVKGEKRQENDLEHASQLAMMAWYIANTNKLRLDCNQLFKYALAHDLVEIYAGDTNFYRADLRTKKHLLETKAARRLQKEFPEFPDLHKTIKNYELRHEPESKFIYALDKVLPVINIYLDRGRTWQIDKVTLQMLIDHKTNPVKINPTIEKYFAELIKLLKRHKNYFPRPK